MIVIKTIHLMRFFRLKNAPGQFIEYSKYRNPGAPDMTGFEDLLCLLE